MKFSFLLDLLQPRPLSPTVLSLGIWLPTAVRDNIACMPKRTDDFQRLVFLIQHQLKDRPNTVVNESRMLSDRQSGLKREVDIVVECTPNGLTCLLAFECCRAARKATIEWVERMLKKHEYLSDKLILVTRSGFRPNALDLARRNGVEAVTLREATAKDWPAEIDEFSQLFFCTFDFTITDCQTECDPTPVLGPVPEFPAGHDRMLVNARGEAQPFNEAARSIVQSHHLFGRQAANKWYALPLTQRMGTHSLKYEIKPEEDLAVLDNRMLYRVRRIYGTASLGVAEANVSLRPNQYQDMRIMHGTAELDSGPYSGSKVHLMLGEKLGEAPKGTVMLTSRDQKAEPCVRTVDLETTQRRR